MREFEKWLAGKGFGRCEVKQYIPSATPGEFAAMKAAGGRMSPLYLLSDSEELHFLCDDPATFDGWGALSHKWRHFLNCPARAAAWEKWQEEKDAHGLDDGISELETI